MILPELAVLLPTGSELLSLVKPQFEVGPEGVNAQGLVTDPNRYTDVEAKLRLACDTHGFEIHHWCESPILGGDGNHEFLLYARRR